MTTVTGNIDPYVPWRRPDGRPLVKDIVAAATRLQGVSLADMRSDRRDRSICHARQRTMWLIRTVRPDWSFRRIAVQLGRQDHTTAINACARVEERIAVDPTEAALAEALLEAVDPTRDPDPLDEAIYRAATLLARLQARRQGLITIRRAP